MEEHTDMPNDARSTDSPRARLIHVGPHKTGTTTVQSAFHRNRDALTGLGVHYLGDRLQPTQAAKSTAGMYPPGPRRDAGLEEWRALLAEAAATPARQVVLSSEFFCEAGDDAARRIVEDFAPDRVVVTLRSLAKVMPSQWQQFVQTGSVRSLSTWVRAVLDDAGADSSVAFWRRHRHDRLVARWAGVVGPENVTVIVSDSRDPGQLPREFARLLGVPEDVLVPASSTHNRSLTWEEAEGIRRFNIAFREQNERRAAAGEPLLELTSTQRLRAWGRVKKLPPEPAHHRIELPAFALDRVEELSREIVEAILASGVEVLGPVDQLLERPRASGWNPDDDGAELAVPPHVTRVGDTLLRKSTASLTGA